MPRSYCFPRPKKYPPYDAVPGDESYYTDYHEWNDDGCCKHCKVSRRQAAIDGRNGATPHPTPRAAPLESDPIKPGEPSFYIEVVLGTRYGDEFPRISWHCAGGFNRPIGERRALLGRYACHRVNPVGVGIPLLAPSVEVPLDVARELLEAFSTGVVRNEAVQALAAAIRDRE